MIDAQRWLRQGQHFGGRVRDRLGHNHGRPDCPRCHVSHSVRLVRVEIDELPGLPTVERRNWQCRTCGTVVRETVTPS